MPSRDSISGAADPSPAGSYAFQNVIGESEPIRRSIGLGMRVAEHGTTTVLIRGETGTGKELFARGIHYASASSGEPFVAINCAAIPENLLESELFGHEKGAFTGAHSQRRGLLELAGRGTVFLDEISELPMNLQPKLLRVVEDKRVRRLGGFEERDISCRIIAATNRDLVKSVAEGRFREDLYYRLTVFHIDLPPLRERSGDVITLARHFVEMICRGHGLPIKEVTPDVCDLLRTHDWPGNIRELKNTVERAIILSDSGRIETSHILLQQRSNMPAEAVAEARQVAGVIAIPVGGLTLEEAERQLFAATLRLANQNQTRAAEMLGVSRPTIIRKIRKFKLLD